MRLTLTLALLLATLPAQAIQPAHLIGIYFDRGVFMCKYEAADRHKFSLPANPNTSLCESFVWVP